MLPLLKHSFDTRVNTATTVATPGSNVLNLDKPCLIGDYREVTPAVIKFLKQTGAHPERNQCRRDPVHRRSSSGMIRLSTARQPGETVINKHDTVSLVHIFLASLRLSSRLVPVSKPGLTGAVYRDSVNNA